MAGGPAPRPHEHKTRTRKGVMKKQAIWARSGACAHGGACPALILPQHSSSASLSSSRRYRSS